MTHDDEQRLESEVAENGVERGFLRPLGVKVADFAPNDAVLTVYPTNTLEGHERCGEPKYERIKSIEIEFRTVPSDLAEALELLPPGLVKDPRYGLGFLKDANRLVRMIEKHSRCRTIRLSLSGDLGVDGETFRIPLSEFDALWSELMRVISRSQGATSRVKTAVTQDALKDALGLPPGKYEGGRHAHSKFVEREAAGEAIVSAADGESIVDSLTSRPSEVLGTVSPVKLKQLQQDVELVNLDRLIDSFRSMLKRRLTEEKWQQFFDDNAFALQQVFGAPLVRMQSKASVGGTGIHGASGKIADYLVRHSLTNNIALVEIKRPDTKLLAKTAYRSGVYPASRELSGAITQVLDQRYHVTQEFLTLKANSRQWDLESHSVACFVVAGRIPAATDLDQQKSLSLIRENSKNVTIITYDEVLERMVQLRDFLGASDDATEGEDSH